MKTTVIHKAEGMDRFHERLRSDALMKPPPTLIIRNSDHAIFERCTAPARENPPLFLRVEWVKRSFWWGGKFVPTGETWQPADDSEYEIVERRLVELGAKELARRK